MTARLIDVDVQRTRSAEHADDVRAAAAVGRGRAGGADWPPVRLMIVPAAT
jgi:hypothetical protein